MRWRRSWSVAGRISSALAGASSHEDIRPCVRCNRCHGRRRAPWTSVCTVNPCFGVELKTKNMVQPVERVKRVAILGAGPAGMQAAITAGQRGHRVSLFEKSDYLGGQLFHADHFSFKWPFKNYRLWLISQMEKLGVEVKTNCCPEPEELKAMGFDAVLAAAGGFQEPDEMEAILERGGADLISVGRGQFTGCSETGIETACYLAEHGHNVTCLTRQNALAKDASPLHSITIAWISIGEDGRGHMAPFWERFPNLRGITEATTLSVTPTSVTYEDAAGAKHILEGTDVIVCGGVRPRELDALRYALCAPEFYVIGDAGGARDIQTSVRSGFAAASQL